MSKLTNFTILVLACGFFTYCATTYKLGQPYPAEHVPKITMGQTSENDIIDLFGDPWKVGIINGHIVYTYCYEEVVFHHNDSIDQNGNTLVVEFDEKKNVLNYYFNIPGKRPNILGLMMHKNNTIKEEQEQVAWQN